MIRDRFWRILSWVIEAFFYSIGVLLIPGILLIFSELFSQVGEAYITLLNSVGFWTIVPFIVIGILIKIVRDYYKLNRTETKVSLNEIGAVALLIVLSLFGLALLGRIIDRENQVGSKIFVYACPIEEETKCYELSADEIKCVEDYGEGCEEWETTIYFPDGGSSYLSCYSLSSGKLHCTDEEDKEWEIEESAKKDITEEEKRTIEELLPE